MPSVRDIRRRIRSIQNTGKVTGAMSLIAASKMRRVQNAVMQGRPYSEKIQEVITHLAAQPLDDPDLTSPLLKTRPVKKIEVVAITPDRGLCGGMHANLNRRLVQFVMGQSSPVTITVVGRKGRDFLVRYGMDLEAVFTDLGDRPTVLDISAIAKLVNDNFTAGTVDEVYLAYTKFVSTVTQQPVVERLLPVTPSPLKAAERVGYIYEPDSLRVLGELLPRFVEMEIYHGLQESIASEQSARMVAMRNATDNSKELSEDLTVVMNKLRQESITNELLDLISGAAAQER